MDIRDGVNPSFNDLYSHSRYMVIVCVSIDIYWGISSEQVHIIIVVSSVLRVNPAAAE